MESPDYRKAWLSFGNKPSLTTCQGACSSGGDAKYEGPMHKTVARVRT